MKLTLERQPLLRALGIAHRIVERRNTIPILSNILFQADAGALLIKATDLDIEVSLSLACDVESPGSTTVPGHLFHDIVRKVPDGAMIALEVTQHGQITVRSGRSRFTLQTLPSVDYPDITHGTMPCVFDVPSANLKRLIDKTQFAVSTEETRYYLNGIFVHMRVADNAPVLRAAATDGHRLAQSSAPMPPTTAPGAATGELPDMIWPRKSVGEIHRILESCGDTVRISCSTTKIKIEAGDVTLVSKLIDGTFPDYHRVIPTGNSKRLVVSKAALSAMLDRVTTLSSERGRIVRINLQDGRMTASVNNPDAGLSSDEIDVSYDDAPLTIGFNSRYMLDILAAITGDEVLMKFDHPGAPLLISPMAGDASDVFVLVPVRVQSDG